MISIGNAEVLVFFFVDSFIYEQEHHLSDGSNNMYKNTTAHL